MDTDTCALCQRAESEYRGYCLYCAELIDLIIQAKKRMKRWNKIRKPCGCPSCVNQEARDTEYLNELIALGVEVKEHGW